MRKKILVFTGAGVSAESGVKTFRDNDGLWNNYKVEEVATTDAWKANPEKCLDFYNERKKEMKFVAPNMAHLTIKELENWFDVTVVTQNVDDLHEKAGSSKIIHLHGELSKARSSEDPNLIFDYTDSIKLGDLAPDGAQMRPHVVLFGEDLDFDKLEEVKEEAKNADICIIIGTSMRVYPAAGIPFLTPETCIIYYIDPSDVEFQVPKMRSYFFTHLQDTASHGIAQVKEELIQIFE